jgi:hypothetical protein
MPEVGKQIDKNVFRIKLIGYIMRVRVSICWACNTRNYQINYMDYQNKSIYKINYNCYIE